MPPGQPSCTRFVHDAPTRTGRYGRHLVFSAVIATAFAQHDTEAVGCRWRKGADRFRPNSPVQRKMPPSGRATRPYRPLVAPSRTRRSRRGWSDGRIERHTAVAVPFPTKPPPTRPPSLARPAPTCPNTTEGGPCAAPAARTLPPSRAPRRHLLPRTARYGNPTQADSPERRDERPPITPPRPTRYLRAAHARPRSYNFVPFRVLRAPGRSARPRGRFGAGHVQPTRRSVVAPGFAAVLATPNPPPASIVDEPPSPSGRATRPDRREAPQQPIGIGARPSRIRHRDPSNARSTGQNLLEKGGIRWQDESVGTAQSSDHRGAEPHSTKRPERPDDRIERHTAAAAASQTKPPRTRPT